MTYKLVKRIARVMLPCFVFFVFSFSFAPKAHAVEYTENWQIGFNHGYFSGSDFMNINPLILEKTLPVVSFTTSSNYGYQSGFYAYPRFISMPTTTFQDVVRLYASFVPVGSVNNKGVLTVSDAFLSRDGWEVSYINTNNQTGYVESGLVSIDTYPDSSSKTGVGYAIEAQWQGSEILPIRSLQVMARNETGNGFMLGGGNGNWNIRYNSVRVITTVYSDEMAALDNVASEIAAQSEILLAMKGDIVAILQDIYTMTGDMYIAQNLLNSYVAEMLPLLENIDKTTTNIYSLLASQLRLLETAIENAADSVEAAIAAQTAAMIAYLDSVLNTGNEVPDDTYQQTQDAENILNQLEQLEKPNVDTIVPSIDDYSNGDVSGVLNAVWGSNLIMTMATLSVSLAFGAYVLFGKRS